MTANLANFSYDPINYEHLRLSAVPQLFVELLRSLEPRLVLNGIAGLCNCCLGECCISHLLASHATLERYPTNKTLTHHIPPDPSIRSDLLATGTATIDLIAALLIHSNAAVQLNALTTLTFLHSTEAAQCCPLICTPVTIRTVRQLQQQASSAELRLLATLFVTDYAHTKRDVALGAPPAATSSASIRSSPHQQRQQH